MAFLNTVSAAKSRMAGSTWSRLGRGLRRDRFAQFGLALLSLLALAAIFAPIVAPYSPVHGTLAQAYSGPSSSHWLGTDGLGRDTFSRVVYGARVAWLAGLEAVGVGSLLGVPLGIAMGFVGGRLDVWGMRAVEAVIAVPGLVLAIALISVTGPGVYQAMFAVGIVFATILLRFARGEAKAASGELWVTAALASGINRRRVMTRHVLPYTAPALIVQMTLLFAAAVLAEAGLSFLGLGVQPPAASWGGMLSTAQDTIATYPLQAIPPGVAIVLMVLAINLVGDGLRDALGTTAPGKTSSRRRRSRYLSSRAAAGAASRANPPLKPSPVATRSHSSRSGNAALEISALTVTFPDGEGREIAVVQDVSISVAQGEIMALVGETGSGKSMIAKAVLGIVPEPGRVHATSIIVGGVDVVGRSNKELRQVRGRKLGVVFQDPKESLNPAFRVGHQLSEVLSIQGGQTRRAAHRRAIELLDQVGIPDASRQADLYPHEFSGGMAQRAMIAMALACDPAVLIADEPTTSLDVTVQAQILDLLLDLRQERGMATLLITHDLSVVADVADSATVLYAGQVSETAACKDLFRCPAHP